jgi:phytoene dehydrogenase-like protein
LQSIEVLSIVPSNPAAWGVTPAEASDGSYRSNAKYQDIKARIEADMIRRLDAQFPGLASRIVFKETATPLSHARFTHGGSAYGIACSVDQFQALRPGHRLPTVQNLYLCGHSTQPSHGISGAMRGGADTAASILKSLKM